MAKFTRDLTAICWVLGIAAYTYGYGNASFITILGQPGFYISMGLDSTTEHTANIIGACNALFTAGAAMGALLQGFVADRIGRKGGLAVASGLSLIGGALVAGAVNIAMIITVRLLQGLGLGMLICLVPLYLAETAPPSIRGFMSGLTVLAFGFGYETCAIISIGSYFAKDHVLQWRLPLGLACLSPILLLALLPIIPESPRYLVWKGHNEKALMILKKLHHNPTNEGDCLATAEFVQIQSQVEHDKELKAGYLDILRRPSWRKRALCVLFLLFASQSTGILGIANFMVLISQGLGFKGVLPIVIFTAWSLTGTVGVIISIYIVDRVGRRNLLLIGYTALTVILLSEALLEMRFLGTTDSAGLAACMLFLFLYILAYQCVDAPSFVWANEIWPTTLRAKGASLSWFAYFCGAITYTTPGALMLKNIKWHVYLLYMSLCAISAVIVYFFIPETKGKPMEELATLFGDEVMVTLTADGQGVIKHELDDLVDSALAGTGGKDKSEGGVHVEEVPRA